jgi:hypothetical protein
MGLLDSLTQCSAQNDQLAVLNNDHLRVTDKPEVIDMPGKSANRTCSFLRSYLSGFRVNQALATLVTTWE